MYVIGNIVLGTYLPWDPEGSRELMMAYVATDPTPWLGEGETPDDLMASAEQGDLDITEFMDNLEDMDGWVRKYHGAAPSTVAYLGVRVGEIDETDHFDLTETIRLAGEVLFPTHPSNIAARRMYDALPSAVRAVLPPFGLYVVWSSS